MKSNQKLLDKAQGVIQTYDSTVESINKQANDKIEEINRHENQLKKQSYAPKFNNRRERKPRIDMKSRLFASANNQNDSGSRRRMMGMGNSKTPYLMNQNSRNNNGSAQDLFDSSPNREYKTGTPNINALMKPTAASK